MGNYGMHAHIRKGGYRTEGVFENVTPVYNCPTPTRRQNRKLMTLIRNFQFQVATVLKSWLTSDLQLSKNILNVQLNSS